MEQAVPTEAGKGGRVIAAATERTLLLIIFWTAILSAGLIFLIVGDVVLAAGFLAATIILGMLLVVARTLFPPATTAKVEFDWALMREAAENGETAIAVTDRAGRLVCANALRGLPWVWGIAAKPA